MRNNVHNCFLFVEKQRKIKSLQEWIISGKSFMFFELDWSSSSKTAQFVRGNLDDIQSSPSCTLPHTFWMLCPITSLKSTSLLISLINDIYDFNVSKIKKPLTPLKSGLLNKFFAALQYFVYDGEEFHDHVKVTKRIKTCSNASGSFHRTW